MSDNRVRIPLNGKQVDLEALDAETGGHGLCSSSEDVVVAEGSSVTEAELRAAIDAHVYTEPSNPDDALRQAIGDATTLDELKAALLGSAPGAAARVAGRPA